MSSINKAKKFTSEKSPELTVDFFDFCDFLILQFQRLQKPFS